MANAPTAGATSIIGHATSVHDPAIAVIAGDFVFAEAVERHTQCKFAHHLSGFEYSWRAVRAALRRAGASLTDAVTVRTSWPPRDADSPIPDVIEGYGRDLYRSCVVAEHSRDLNEKFYVEELVQNVADFPRTWRHSHRASRPIAIEPMPHHLTHAALAAYTSPFDECVVLVADGTGEEDWLTTYHFDGRSFRRLGHVPSLHCSLGGLYEVVTQLCGFSHIDHEEWKVMGLAAYAERDDRIYDFFRSKMRVRELAVELDLEEHSPHWVAELERLTGPFRRRDEPGAVERSGPLARSFQDCFDDVMAELAANLRALGLSENLAFAGGLALNSSCNGKLVERSGFARLHVPSAPGDDGCALGAALYELYHERGAPRTPAVMSPYLGSAIPDEDVAKIASFGGFDVFEAPDDEALCGRAAALLADGKIVGWCQGRAEFGPRALGNRSILADPRSARMKDEINRRVKFREEFRPLAPSILHEYGEEYFENYQFSPYMERALRFREGVRAAVPAVVHLDGTGRLQSVTRELNPLYYQLIDAFRRRSGVPLVLNTSFNVMGKPIVHGATDALAVFFSSGLDALAIGRRVLTKR